MIGRVGDNLLGCKMAGRQLRLFVGGVGGICVDIGSCCL